MVKEKELITRGLRFARYHRIHPENVDLFGRIYYGFITTMRILFMGFTIKYIEANAGNLSVLIEGCDTMISNFQGLVKFIPLYFYRKSILWLLDQQKHFWKVSHDYKVWKRVLDTYLVLGHSVLIALTLRAISIHSLTFRTWIPNFPYSFYILFIAQYIQLVNDLHVVMAMDVFFLGTCILLIYQYRLINDKLAELNLIQDSNQLECEFHHIIRHHNFLLKYFKIFERVVRMPLLAQYLLSLLSICLQLYDLTEKKSLAEFIASFVYVFVLGCQLALYCFPADEVISYAASLTDHLYSFNWYEKPVKIQKYVRYILQISHIPLEFKAGGMMLINRKAFSMVFKSAVSIYTLLLNIKNK